MNDLNDDVTRDPGVFGYSGDLATGEGWALARGVLRRGLEVFRAGPPAGTRFCSFLFTADRLPGMAETVYCQGVAWEPSSTQGDLRVELQGTRYFSPGAVSNAQLAELERRGWNPDDDAMSAGNHSIDFSASRGDDALVEIIAEGLAAIGADPRTLAFELFIDPPPVR